MHIFFVLCFILLDIWKEEVIIPDSKQKLMDAYIYTKSTNSYCRKSSQTITDHGGFGGERQVSPATSHHSLTSEHSPYLSLPSSCNFQPVNMMDCLLWPSDQSGIRLHAPVLSHTILVFSQHLGHPIILPMNPVISTPHDNTNQLADIMAPEKPNNYNDHNVPCPVIQQDPSPIPQYHTPTTEQHPDHSDITRVSHQILLHPSVAEQHNSTSQHNIPTATWWPSKKNGSINWDDRCSPSQY